MAAAKTMLRVMPSWRASDAPREKVATKPGTAAATEIERARHLLEQLFGRPRDDQPPQPKQ